MLRYRGPHPIGCASRRTVLGGGLLVSLTQREWLRFTKGRAGGRLARLTDAMRVAALHEGPRWGEACSSR